PNPKTSGVARWNYLAAWGYALKEYGSQEKAREFVSQLFKHVPVLDSGARGATTTFVERGLGDVLINWENELLLVKKLRGDEFEVVVPSVSILAEPTVSVVDKIVDKRGTREVATEYLKFLYSDTGQEIAARHFFRPSNKEILAKHASQYPKLELFTITDVFGGWTKATKEHFVDGAAFDQVYSGSGEKK
ncbi:MAG: sulfate ABC transporter substrate-binding protein, partial [Terrimicrobiaceae bacterium]